MLKNGDIVISKAGHDEGRPYIVLKERDEDFVLVVDGKYRKLDNPKIKRIKHVKKIGESSVMADNIAAGKISDAEIAAELRTQKEDKIN